MIARLAHRATTLAPMATPVVAFLLLCTMGRRW